MTRITFGLTWDDIHTALDNYVKEKAKTAFELNEDDITQTFISFTDKEGKQVHVETANVIIKKIT